MSSSSPSPRRPPGTAPFLPDRWWALPLERRRQVAVAVASMLILLPVAAWWLLTPSAGDDGTAAASQPTAADQFVAELPPERVATWDSLAECETGGDWSAETGNGFSGGLQFTEQSWEAVGGTGSPAAASRTEQIMRAEMLYDDQGWGAWPNCSRQLGLV